MGKLTAILLSIVLLLTVALAVLIYSLNKDDNSFVNVRSNIKSTKITFSSPELFNQYLDKWGIKKGQSSWTLTHSPTQSVNKIGYRKIIIQFLEGSTNKDGITSTNGSILISFDSFIDNKDQINILLYPSSELINMDHLERDKTLTDVSLLAIHQILKPVSKDYTKDQYKEEKYRIADESLHRNSLIFKFAK